MSYGKVISGGKAMTKGVTKGINDKLASFAVGHSRAASLAGAVRKAFTQNPLSDNHTNNVNGHKFTTPKLPKNV